MLKRILLLMVVIGLILGLVGFQHASGSLPPVTVFLDGKQVEFDVSPSIINNRTMVPFRAIGEAMGAMVFWFPDSRQVFAYRDNTYVVMNVGEKAVWINDRMVEIDAAPVIINDRTLVPIRFFTEAFGFDVSWCQDARRVDIINIFGRTGKPKKHVLAWYAMSSYGDFTRNLNNLTSSAYMWYTPDENGNLLTVDSYWGVRKPDNYSEVMDIARTNNVQNHMMVFMINTASSGNKLIQLLESPIARTRLINSILLNVLINGYDGVNIDFENIPPSQRDNLNAFMKELYSKLNPLGIKVTIAVPAMTERSTWFMAFDYKTLGENSDYIAIMAYDRDPSRPIHQAPINWIDDITNYALTYVPKEKILLGLGVYGYEFLNGRRTGTVLLERAEMTWGVRFLSELKDQFGGESVWSDTAKMHSYTYVDSDGNERTVFYECAASIEEKMKLVVDKGLGGVAIWRLGYMTQDTWDVITKYIDPK